MSSGSASRSRCRRKKVAARPFRWQLRLPPSPTTFDRSCPRIWFRSTQRAPLPPPPGEKDAARVRGVDRVAAIWSVGVHLLALLVFVPWFFSWTGVVLLAAGIYLFGMIGINLGYHRLLA